MGLSARLLLLFTANKLRSWRPVTKRKPLGRRIPCLVLAQLTNCLLGIILNRRTNTRTRRRVYSLRESANIFTRWNIDDKSCDFVAIFFLFCCERESYRSVSEMNWKEYWQTMNSLIFAKGFHAKNACSQEHKSKTVEARVANKSNRVSEILVRTYLNEYFLQHISRRSDWKEKKKNFPCYRLTWNNLRNERV